MTDVSGIPVHKRGKKGGAVAAYAGLPALRKALRTGADVLVAEAFEFARLQLIMLADLNTLRALGQPVLSKGIP